MSLHCSENVFRYLLATKDVGLTYWRPTPKCDLPDLAPPQPITPAHEWNVNLDGSLHVSSLQSFVDSDWASDSTHCRLVIGFLYMLAGASIVYKTRFQSAVALSFTEAEFVAASDAGKLSLYLHSLLDELGLDHNKAILLYEDNTGAFMMADASKPTQQTRHIDICHFALPDWVERDLICLEQISMTLNTADVLTKSTPRIIFHCHNNILMGKLSPHSFTKVHACFVYAVQ